MPLLAYFGIVGSILIGLLYVAEARLGPASPSVGLSTNFHGLPAPFKEASTRILTARDAPAPPVTEEKLVQSEVTPAPAATTKIVVRPKAKKVAKAPRPVSGPNIFAQSGAAYGKNHRVW
jgi:hypothetical protein